MGVCIPLGTMGQGRDCCLGLLPSLATQTLGFTAPVGRRQSHAAGQHPWGMPNHSPGCLFTMVFLSWILALISSVTTLWSASQEPELSFQLAGTLGLCCIPLCLPGLFCSSQTLLYSDCRGFSQHIPCVSLCSVMVCDEHGVLRLPRLCVLLFTFVCFSLQLGILEPAQKQALKHPVCKL